MASIRKENGKWRAYIYKCGIRKTKTFETKPAARDWALKQEALLSEQKSNLSGKLTVRDILQRYMEEVTPTHRGERWERIRLQAFCKMPIADVLLSDLTDEHIREWRDDRLKSVSGATVLREWTVLSAVFSHAVTEWKLLSGNPMSSVKRPKDNPPRERRITEGEVEKLLYVADYDGVSQPKNRTQRVMLAFLFAIETAMRAGEITGIKKEHINLDERTVFLPMTKNGSSRTVPLSTRAVQILKLLPDDDVFGLTPGALDVLFRKVRDKAGIADLHFHDTRHEAVSRLAKKLDVLDLARMIGHRNLKLLMVYYNASAKELAARLD